MQLQEKKGQRIIEKDGQSEQKRRMKIGENLAWAERYVFI